MKRQVTELQTSVYSYGAVPARIAPTRNEDAAIKQLWLANRLWNVLVAIERARVERYRLIMRDESQERIDVLKLEAKVLRTEIRARRKTARKRSVDIGDLSLRLATIKTEMRVLIETRKETSQERHAAKRAELTMMQDRTKRRIKRARQAASRMGLFWGTYNDIVQRADAGRKLGGVLHFRRFQADGTVTAQIIGGTRCLETHSFFQLDRPTPGQRWRYARMRIGSNTDRSPVWLEIPIVYHRDLPADADIKSVSMTRRPSDGKAKVKWQLNVTLNRPQPTPAVSPASIAIDIGWRSLPKGVRLAYWRDTLGKDGQVVILRADTDQEEYCADLRATEDRTRNEFLPALCAWIEAQPALTDEWRARTAYLAQWRSCDRLAALIAWWRDNRLDSDTEVFDAAQLWRKEYLHLAHQRRNLQEKITLRIREQYRVFAADIARRYGTVYLERFDLRQVVEKLKPENDDTNGRAGQRYRQMVSPSAFRAALLNACRREGVAVKKIEAGFTTRVCNVCGTVNKWDQAASVIHRCQNEQCPGPDGRPAVWDQDLNAAINILAVGLKGDQAMEAARA